MEQLQSWTWMMILLLVMVVAATTICLVIFAAVKVMRDEWDRRR